MPIGTSSGQTFDHMFDYTLNATGNFKPAPPTIEVTHQEKVNEGFNQMFGGLQEPGEEQTRPATGQGGQHLAAVLDQPEVQKALRGKINRDYKVPYIAGSSEAGDTTYIDKSVPKEITVSGVKFDPAVPLRIHEQVERNVMSYLMNTGMDKGKAYSIAHHEYAEHAEDMWYRSHGISVKDANAFWSSIDKHTEQENTADHPPDLYKAPYSHDHIEGNKHHSPGDAAEWPATTPGTMSDAQPQPIAPGQQYAQNDESTHQAHHIPLETTQGTHDPRNPLAAPFVPMVKPRPSGPDWSAVGARQQQPLTNAFPNPLANPGASKGGPAHFRDETEIRARYDAVRKLNTPEAKKETKALRDLLRAVDMLRPALEPPPSEPMVPQIQQQQQARHIGPERQKVPERIVDDPEKRAVVQVQGVNYYGLNHYTAYEKAVKDLGEDVVHRHMKDGFMTTWGRFIDRKEAARLGVKTGQVVGSSQYNPRGLISEDMLPP